MRVLKILSRVWLPLVVLLVFAIGAYTVLRLHSAFGPADPQSYAGSRVAEDATVSPKTVVYEVFGPEGAVADISYFDVDSAPQQISGAALPWSLTLTPNSPGMIGSIVAQGDSDSIGCRILVDGEVRAEKITNQVSAFTHCLVTGA